MFILAIYILEFAKISRYTGARKGRTYTDTSSQCTSQRERAHVLLAHYSATRVIYFRPFSLSPSLSWMYIRRACLATIASIRGRWRSFALLCAATGPRYALCARTRVHVYMCAEQTFLSVSALYTRRSALPRGSSSLRARPRRAREQILRGVSHRPFHAGCMSVYCT